MTYVITERSGGPNSGYISSGFFGGRQLFSRLLDALAESFQVLLWDALRFYG